MHGTYTLDTFEGTTFWSGGGRGMVFPMNCGYLTLFPGSLGLIPRHSWSHSQALWVSFPGTLGLGTRLVVSRQQRVQVVTNKVRM